MCGGLPCVAARPRPSPHVSISRRFRSPSRSPDPSKATAVARDPHSGAKFGRVALVLATVSKTVSGGFPLTRVRIPPPPFFREIWLGSRGNGRPDRLRRPGAGAPTDVHERPSWQISFPRRSPEQSRKRALPATVGLEHSRCRHSGSAGGSRGHGDRGRLSRRVIAHGVPRRPAEAKRSSRPPSRTAP